MQIKTIIKHFTTTRMGNILNLKHSNKYAGHLEFPYITHGNVKWHN